MGSPKSFKDIFKNRKQVPFTGGQLLVPPAPNRQITVAQKEALEKQKKDLLDYVNTQRCAVCGQQLDGPVNEKDAKLYCVADNDHYTCRYIPDQELPSNYKSIYNFPDKAIGYMVGGDLNNNKQYYNWIYQLDLNLIERFRFRDKKLVLSYEGSLLKFPINIDYDGFSKKLRIYTVFH